MGMVLLNSLLRAAGGVPLTALVYAPDGSALVSNGDRRVDVRSPHDAQVVRHVPCDLVKITAAAFAPQGAILALAGGDPGVTGEIRLLSWPTLRELHRFPQGNDLVYCLAFNASGTQLGVGSGDHSGRVWDLDDKGMPGQSRLLKGHAGPVLGISFGPNGTTVVTASADRSLKVWNPATGEILRSFSHHTEGLQTVVFRPAVDPAGPAVCASGGEDRTVRIWQPEIGRMVRIVRQHAGSIQALAWSRDGGSLFSAGREGIIRHIDGASDAILSEWKASDHWIYCLALSPDGTVLASGDWAGRVQVHPLSNNASAPAPGPSNAPPP